MNQSIFDQLLDFISSHSCGLMVMRNTCAPMVDDSTLQEEFWMTAAQRTDDMVIIQDVADLNGYNIPGGEIAWGGNGVSNSVVESVA